MQINERGYMTKLSAGFCLQTATETLLPTYCTIDITMVKSMDFYDFVLHINDDTCL